MSANSKTIVFQLVQIAKNSSLLKKQITKIENQIIDEGLGLVESAGLNVELINQVVDLRALLRGEAIGFDMTALLKPEIICSQPITTPEQRDALTKKINDQKKKVEEIYTTVNNIKLQIEAIKVPIVKLQESITPTTDLVSTIAQIIQVLKKLPAPSAAPPGIGLPLSIFNTFSSILKNLDDTVLVIASNLSSIPDALGGMVQMVNSIGNKITIIPKVIDPFIKLLTMVQSIVDLQDQCPLVTQEDIDNVQSNLESGILGSISAFENVEGLGNVLEERLSLNTDNPYFYKNFRFILENDPDNSFSFPSRRIKMSRRNSTGFDDGEPGGGPVTLYNINEQTNPFEPPNSYSYGSDLQVLVSQGKFAVDVYTKNITAFTDQQILLNSFASKFNPKTSVSGSYTTSYSTEEGQVVQLFLPNFILYGKSIVNLNSSPTNIEYGADRLAEDGNYAFGSGIELNSYIETGTLQVNNAVNINLKTFGGTGNPITISGSVVPRFTEARLTFKRSAAIQDDVNPYTGRIAGSNQDAIDDFIKQYGKQALSTVDLMNEVANEVTNKFEDVFGGNNLQNATFEQKLEYVFNEWYGIDTETTTSLFEIQSGNSEGDNNTEFEEREIDVIKPRNQGEQIKSYIRALWKIASGLVNNSDVLYRSKLLYGDQEQYAANVTSQKFEEIILERDRVYSAGAEYNQQGSQKGYNPNVGLGVSTEEFNNMQLENENWYWSAGKIFDDPSVNWTYKGQAAGLSMLLFSLRQFKQTFKTLYGDRIDYNNGAWVSPGVGIPLIPSQVGPDNEDITIELQSTQLADVNETINQRIGSLSVLGTYTYELEIVDSLPRVGGSQTNFPTNYVSFTVEDSQPSSLPILTRN